MSTTGAGLEPSVWTTIEGDDNAPKECPHCHQPLAHPDDLRDNEDVDASGLFTAYRRHRQAHFEWGFDPTRDGEKRGDPYLGSYYNTDRDATWEPDDGPSGDPDEEVTDVFDVEINYEYVMRGRVVAANESQAKEKLKRMRDEERDLYKEIPTPYMTHEVHSSARQVRSVTRKEVIDSSDVDEKEDDGVNYADRLEGWPW